MSAPQVALSCQQCQRRKTKCDKKDPCSSCTAADIKCQPVKRHRLPRGRSGNKASVRSALRERVGRLESLLSQAQDGRLATQMQNASMCGDDATRVDQPGDPRTGMESFVASDFWEELTGTVSGLRDILQEPDEADVDDESTTTAVSISETLENGQASAHRLLFETLGSSAVPLDHRDTPQLAKHRMLSTYHKRVDSIFKVLHWPTAAMAIQILEHTGYDKPSCIASSVLEAAVYFLAVCSLRDTEVGERQMLVQQYRAITERAFARCNLLTTTNFTVLQAFVIYLAGLRASQANAQQWTLMATATRLASAQNIPSYSGSTEYALLQETQRRVWHCIGLLDLQSAFDRGTQPMLRFSDFRAAPLNVDDTDLYWGLSVSELSSRKNAFTEMSFSVIVNKAMVCQTQLIEIGMRAASVPEADQALAVGDQRALLAAFEAQVKELEDLVGPNPTPIQQYTISVATESLVAMQLLIHRPLHKRGRASWNTESTADDKPDILGMATDVLERSQNKRSLEMFQQWAWFSWVKWYALAIVLVELCCHSHFSPLAGRAWEAASRSYDDYAQAVADTQKGLLWKPIAKLMRNARSVRSDALSHPQVPLGSVQQNLPLSGLSDHVRSMPSKEPDTDLPFVAPADIKRGISHDQHDTQTTGGDFDMSWLQWEALVDDIYMGDDYTETQAGNFDLLSTFASN